MKEKSTTKNSASQTQWKHLAQKNDKHIDYRDIAPTSAKFWEDAEIVLPEPKTHLSIRLDTAIVDFFKELGPGYQSRINAVLKAYMKAHKKT